MNDLCEIRPSLIRCEHTSSSRKCYARQSRFLTVFSGGATTMSMLKSERVFEASSQATEATKALQQVNGQVNTSSVEADGMVSCASGARGFGRFASLSPPPLSTPHHPNTNPPRRVTRAWRLADLHATTIGSVLCSCWTLDVKVSSLIDANEPEGASAQSLAKISNRFKLPSFSSVYASSSLTPHHGDTRFLEHYSIGRGLVSVVPSGLHAGPCSRDHALSR